MDSFVADQAVVAGFLTRSASRDEVSGVAWARPHRSLQILQDTS